MARPKTKAWGQGQHLHFRTRPAKKNTRLHNLLPRRIKKSNISPNGGCQYKKRGNSPPSSPAISGKQMTPVTSPSCGPTRREGEEEICPARRRMRYNGNYRAARTVLFLFKDAPTKSNIVGDEKWARAWVKKGVCLLPHFSGAATNSPTSNTKQANPKTGPRRSSCGTRARNTAGLLCLNNNSSKAGLVGTLKR